MMMMMMMMVMSYIMLRGRWCDIFLLDVMHNLRYKGDDTSDYVIIVGHDSGENYFTVLSLNVVYL
jgi:hypothetical protein